MLIKPLNAGQLKMETDVPPSRKRAIESAPSQSHKRQLHTGLDEPGGCPSRYTIVVYAKGKEVHRLNATFVNGADGHSRVQVADAETMAIVPKHDASPATRPQHTVSGAHLCCTATNDKVTTSAADKANTSLAKKVTFEADLLVEQRQQDRGEQNETHTSFQVSHHDEEIEGFSDDQSDGLSGDNLTNPAPVEHLFPQGALFAEGRDSMCTENERGDTEMTLVVNDATAYYAVFYYADKSNLWSKVGLEVPMRDHNLVFSIHDISSHDTKIKDIKWDLRAYQSGDLLKQHQSARGGKTQTESQWASSSNKLKRMVLDKFRLVGRTFKLTKETLLYLQQDEIKQNKETAEGLLASYADDIDNEFIVIAPSKCKDPIAQDNPRSLRLLQRPKSYHCAPLYHWKKGGWNIAYTSQYAKSTREPYKYLVVTTDKLSDTLKHGTSKNLFYGLNWEEMLPGKQQISLYMMPASTPRTTGQPNQLQRDDLSNLMRQKQTRSIDQGVAEEMRLMRMQMVRISKDLELSRRETDNLKETMYQSALDTHTSPYDMLPFKRRRYSPRYTEVPSVGIEQISPMFDSQNADSSRDVPPLATHGTRGECIQELEDHVSRNWIDVRGMESAEALMTLKSTQEYEIQ